MTERGALELIGGLPKRWRSDRFRSGCGQSMRGVNGPVMADNNCSAPARIAAL